MKILTSSEILVEGNRASLTRSHTEPEERENAITHILFLFKIVTFWFLIEFLARIFLQ